MATLFKRNGHGRDDKWLIRYKDADGDWRTVAGFTDKALSKRKGELLEFDADRRRMGVVNPLEDTGPIDEHIRAYEKHLSGKSPVYVSITIARIKSYGFESVAELVGRKASERVKDHLAKIDGNGSNRNHYLTAIKMFCRWLYDFRDLPLSPIYKLRKEKITKGTQRRAATDAEIQKLLKHLDGKRANLTADQRYYLYLTALETGYRAEELQRLTVADFRGKIVHCSKTKNGDEVDQPVTDSYAQIMRAWLKGKSGQVWPGRWFRKAATMLFADLEAAEVPIETDKGRLDFHSLRVTFVTQLAQSGMPAKQVQTLARHSDINLTMNVYAKLGIEDGNAHHRRTKLYVRSCPLVSATARNGSNGKP